MTDKPNVRLRVFLKNPSQEPGTAPTTYYDVNRPEFRGNVRREVGLLAEHGTWVTGRIFVPGHNVAEVEVREGAE